MPNKLKNIFLLIASIFFYSWGAPKFIFVILITTTLDFYLVKMLADTVEQRTRKLFLILSLSLNLSLLFYFKYCNFFIDNFNHLFSFFGAGEIKWMEVVLPIGISFYTFESLTYVIDVYRKEHKPLSNFFQYQLYILFFPKLIAGPIVRFSQIADQITGRFATYNVDKIIGGLTRFMIGLAKKVLIANVMAEVADNAFGLSKGELNAFDCWAGALAYTFQIYFDFSGYSDMAIGLAKVFGFEMPENFNDPYTSKSITEFWRRWHMTLGSWMKNYLYIPLGGNRVNSVSKLYFNLWLVFILSGFWHGASWTFIFWGIYHGFWLVLERIFLGRVLNKLGIFATLITFVIVVFGWVFFRADSLQQAGAFVKGMFQFDVPAHLLLDKKQQFIFSVAAFFSVFTLLPFGKSIQDYFYSRDDKNYVTQLAFIVVCLGLYTLSLASVTSSNFNPFIYFRF
jgi:alginate O-acetyltransferase complex protein AlgI